MKTKSILGLLLTGLIGLSISCKDLTDTYDEYIEGGEIVYRARPVYSEAHSGYLRARIDWSLLFPTQVTKCLIFKQDSLLAEVPVTYGDSIRLSCLLENLEEKAYTLDIYSEDAYGNRSIKTEQFVNIYGPRYVSTLHTNREIEDILREENENDNVKIILSPKTPETLSSEIIYRNMEGQSQTVRIDPDEYEIFLNGVPASGTLSLQDLLQPDTFCIDTFTAPAVNYDLAASPSKSSRTVETICRNIHNATQVSLTLSDPGSNIVKTTIRYPGINGIQMIEAYPEDENTFLLEDVATMGNIELISYFQDSEDAPVYAAAAKKIDIGNLPQKFKPFWKIYEVSDYEYDDGDPSDIFDDNLSTYWHTPYDEYSYIHPDKEDEYYPHWIIIDMGTSITISSFEVARRQDNENFAQWIGFEVSEDGITWEGEEFDADCTIDDMQSFTLSTPLHGRYFKFIGLESGSYNDYMCMSEISVY